MVSCCCCCCLPFIGQSLSRQEQEEEERQTLLKDSQKVIDHVAFGPNRAFFVLYDDASFVHNQLPSDCVEALNKTEDENGEPLERVVYLSMSRRGGWFICRKNGAIDWSMVPSGLHTELVKSDVLIKWVTFAPGDGWIAGYNNESGASGILWESLPRSLSLKVQAAETYGWEISRIAIGHDGSYWMEYDDSRQVWKALPQSLNQLLSYSNGANLLSLSPIDASYFVSISDSGFWDFDSSEFECAMHSTNSNNITSKQQLNVSTINLSQSAIRSDSRKGKDPVHVHWEDQITPESTPLLGVDRSIDQITGSSTSGVSSKQQQMHTNLSLGSHYGKEQDFWVDAVEADIDDVGESQVTFFDPQKIAYTTVELSNRFDDGTSIANTITKLKKRTLKIEDIPPLHVFVDGGTYWSEDNHWLYCFRHAGISSIPVYIVPIPQWWIDSHNQVGEDESDEED